MTTNIAHAYEAEREHTWTNRQELPAQVGPKPVRHKVTRWLQRVLAILLIAGTTMFGALGPVTGSGHTLPPCYGWSTTHQTSIRQPITIRHHRIPVHTVHRLYCRLLPGDPLNQNRAVVIRNVG